MKAGRLIVEAMTASEAFATLGLKQGSSKDEIEKSYRKLSRKYHPDFGGKVEDQQRINAAVALLRKFVVDTVTKPPKKVVEFDDILAGFEGEAQRKPYAPTHCPSPGTCKFSKTCRGVNFCPKTMVCQDIDDLDMVKQSIRDRSAVHGPVDKWFLIVYDGVSTKVHGVMTNKQSLWFCAMAIKAYSMIVGRIPVSIFVQDPDTGSVVSISKL